MSRLGLPKTMVKMKGYEDSPGNVRNGEGYCQPNKGTTTYTSEIKLELMNPLHLCAAAAAKSLQSCPTLCDPIEGSPPGSPIPGILQARYWRGLPLPSPASI